MNALKTERLIIGVGNAGRQDDGLGWAFLDALPEEVREGRELIYRYQLNVEDAELISTASEVIFVDARIAEGGKPFDFRLIEPKASYEFTTHALRPEAVVSLCQHLYQVFPEAYLLTISGREWELKEGLTDFGTNNLKQSLTFFLNSKNCYLKQ